MQLTADEGVEWVLGGWGSGGGCWENMKYVFKCVMPQQDLAGNMCALENGNDLLFKEVAECSISRKKKKKTWWNPKHVSPIQSWVLTDSQRDWIYSIRKHHSLFAWTTNMLACCFIFIHLEVMCAWALVMKDWHAQPAWWGIWKGWLIIQRFVCLCKRLSALWWAFGLMYSLWCFIAGCGGGSFAPW